MVVAGFVAPYLLDTTTRFVQAAATLPDVELALITCEPEDRLPPGLKDNLAGHWRIDDGLDVSQIAAAVQGLGRRLGPVQRLLAVLEQLQVPLAQVRGQLGIPGMGVVTAGNFRDKDQMKTVHRVGAAHGGRQLRAAGTPLVRGHGHRRGQGAGQIKATHGLDALPVRGELARGRLAAAQTGPAVLGQLRGRRLHHRAAPGHRRAHRRAWRTSASTTRAR